MTNKDQYSKEIAELSLNRGREDLDRFEKSKDPGLLHLAYANIAFATWYGLDTKKDIARLDNLGMDVSDIQNWTPSEKVTHSHFGKLKKK